MPNSLTLGDLSGLKRAANQTMFVLDDVTLESGGVHHPLQQRRARSAAILR